MGGHLAQRGGELGNRAAGDIGEEGQGDVALVPGNPPQGRLSTASGSSHRGNRDVEVGQHMFRGTDRDENPHSAILPRRNGDFRHCIVGWGMRIHDILERKGRAVVTMSDRSTVRELLDELTTHGIGAVVIVDDAQRLTGIVSERDIVRHLQRSGAQVLMMAVTQIMTPEPISCGPEDEVEALARTMTEHRIRHLPVVENGQLAGIVSIGDVVKQRLDQLQHERDQLVNYVQHGG